MIETENKKHTNFLLNMKIFHNLKIKIYPHKTLNSSKGVIRNRELSQCSREEILAELKKQGVTDIKRITIKKDNQTIQTNTYILTFNSPTTPKEIKIGYINEKIEQYIPNPLQCFKCQKFGHHGSVCNGHTICGEGEPNHTTINCNLNNRCANCDEDHPSYTRSCPAWKKEKEILTIKHTRNIPYPEARKIVEGCIKKQNLFPNLPKQPKNRE